MRTGAISRIRLIRRLYTDLHGLPAPPAEVEAFVKDAAPDGPSHLETFDYKPVLAKMGGKPMPESMTKGQQIAQLQGKPLNCFAPQHGFQRYGKSSQEFSSLLPLLGTMADELCIIRSVILT